MRNISSYLHNDDTLPVFPLPEFVLFPGVTAPLHIFEPRYRQMIQHALDGKGVFCMALLRDGSRGRHLGNPDFWGMGCACRLLDYDKLPDGRYNILVEGLVKVRMRELPGKALYRTAQVTLTPAEEDPPVEPHKEERIRLLMSRIMAATPEAPQPPEESLEKVAFPMLLNLMAYHCPVAVEDKLKLLYAPTVSQLCDRLIKLYDTVDF